MAQLPAEVRFGSMSEDAEMVAFVPGICEAELAGAKFQHAHSGGIKGQTASGRVKLSGTTDAFASPFPSHRDHAEVHQALALVDTDSGNASVHPLVGDCPVRLAATPSKPSAAALERLSNTEHEKAEHASAHVAFGSRKRQRANERLRARKAAVAPNQLPESGAALADAALADATEATATESVTTEHVAHTDIAAVDVPPRDLDAICAENAYPVLRLSPASQREQLLCDDIAAFMRAHAGSDELTSSFTSITAAKKTVGSEAVATLAQQLVQNTHDVERLVREYAPLLAHLRALIKVFHWPRSLHQMARIGQIDDMPRAVVEAVVESFYEADPSGQGPRTRSSSKESLLLAHILLLALHCTHVFTLTSTEALANDLKLQPRKLADVAKDVGCKVKRLSKAAAQPQPSVSQYSISLHLSPQKPLRQAVPSKPKMVRRNRTEA